MPLGAVYAGSPRCCQWGDYAPGRREPSPFCRKKVREIQANLSTLSGWLLRSSLAAFWRTPGAAAPAGHAGGRHMPPLRHVPPASSTLTVETGSGDPSHLRILQYA